MPCLVLEASLHLYIIVNTFFGRLTNVKYGLINHATKERLEQTDREYSVKTFYFQIQPLTWGGSSVATASDRHAPDSGLIPRSGKGFFSQSQLSVQTLLRCPYTPVCNRMH